MKVLGVIPARGGSKGVPGKNLALLGGKSLLQRAVEAAQDSGALDRIVVDSDNEKILAAARVAGAETLYTRPAELAADEAPTAAAVTYLLDFLAREQAYFPDTIMVLEPTCPLRTAADVAETCRIFEESDKPCALTVCIPSQHPNDFIRREQEGWAHWTPRDTPARGRQDFAEAWFVNGGVYITRTSFFRETGKFYDLAQAAVSVMEPSHSFDIDTPFDLALARAFVSYSEQIKED